MSLGQRHESPQKTVRYNVLNTRELGKQKPKNTREGALTTTKAISLCFKVVIKIRNRKQHGGGTS